ncbi:hypothetical protein EJ07DRAFT_169927 [Lizonia empirigonia]|nr:hypothetical protein EJ07DRAFT_169927 [Lizonia empirigonia]
MASLSRLQIFKSKPIGDGLSSVRNSFNSLCREQQIPASSSALDRIGIEDVQNLSVILISALQILPAARALPSKTGGRYLFSDLSKLNSAVSSDDFDLEQIRPLWNAVLKNESDHIIWSQAEIAVTESTPPPRPTSSILQTPWLRSTGSFANSTEHRKYVDDVLKEELGSMHVGIPGFFEAFFGEVTDLQPAAHAVFERCKTGDNPLYREESGWQGWPEGAKERDVLAWFAEVTGQFSDLAAEHQPASKARRRLLAQPHQPLQGSTADRKLDIGFVDDLSAGAGSTYHWKQILVPGELKSNPLADVASKAWLDLGRYAREVLAAQDSRRFVLGFTLCGSRMRLWNFDRLGGIASSPFDINEEGLQFVSAVLGFLWLNEEQLGFDPTIITAGGKRYIEIERNNRTERLVLDKVIKRVSCVAGRATTCWRAHCEGDESQAPLSTEKDVVNVARYYYHGTVRVSDQDDTIRRNVRRGLDVTKATNYVPESSMQPPSRTVRSLSRKGRSSSTTRRKRSSSCTNAPLPPSKRTCSSSPVKGGRATVDRVHRRVIVRDYGKPIYMASSKTSLLAAMEGCIAGYESLHTRAGMLQCDISPNNLMVNEDEGNPSWHSFLIDLDLAIKEDREKASGARGKTGTRAFMAIGVLHDDEPHSFMHDLESFFWGRVVQQFDKWNYADTEELAKLKLGTENFTKYYQPLLPCVDRLRKKIFPSGRRWREPNPKLYVEMKEILRTARDELDTNG